MKPSDFDESNATYGEDLKAFLGRLPSEDDVRMVSRWRPVRAEIEALAEGASVWVHVMGDHCPPLMLACYDPFKPITHAGSSGGVIDPEDPLEITASLAAMDTLRELFKTGPMDAEGVLERVVKYVLKAEKMRKGLQ